MIVEGENPTTMAKTTGLGLLEIPTILEKLKPDHLMISDELKKKDDFYVLLFWGRVVAPPLVSSPLVSPLLSRLLSSPLLPFPFLSALLSSALFFLL